MEIRIRQMKRTDLNEILAIAADAFPNPWAEELFMRELQLSFSRSLVASESGGEAAPVAGYIIFWLIADEVQLHSIAVRRNLRRKGIASQLLQAMIREALDENAGRCTLEVRNSNEAARNLYEKFGCRVHAVRPSYYPETKEDALIMSVDLRRCPEALRHA